MKNGLVFHKIAVIAIGAVILFSLLLSNGAFDSEAQSLDSTANASAAKAAELSLPKPINPSIELDVAQPVISGSFVGKSDAGGKINFPVQPTGSAVEPEGPDLDLGYCNYLDVRFKTPVGFNGDVNLTYHCTGPGMNGSSESHGTVTIPNSLIPRNGEDHSYRIDMGLQPYWRGRLTGLDLAASAGTANFEGATVGVGDLPGDR